MIKENLSIFFNPNGLGDTALYGSAPINGMFERQFVEISNAEGYYPTFSCSTADVAQVPKGATLIIAGTNYTVKSKRPDGTGLTLIILEEA